MVLGKAISVLWIIVIQPFYSAGLVACSTISLVGVEAGWKMAVNVRQCFLLALLLGANGRRSICLCTLMLVLVNLLSVVVVHFLPMDFFYLFIYFFFTKVGSEM